MPDDDTPASTKLEDADLQLLPDVPPPTLSFRSKKRNRVMQSCVACHSQKRKCDRKRPCTRCTEHGISGQCVYQLEDPAVSRDRTEQDELLRLRGRVAELEKTVRVLMQKPLSKRQAASLDDAILGATGKRKMLDRDGENDDGEGRDRKLPKSTPSGLPANEDPPEWLPFPDPTQPSPLSATSPAFSPFSNAAVSPADVRFHQSFMSFDRYSPDVPTPPYSAFPTPSSDAGSPFKHPGDSSMNRRFSEGSALAGMMSHASMVSPAAMSAASPAAASPAAPLNFHPAHPHPPHHGHPPPTPTSACGCGMNPIGSEVYSGLQTSLDAAFEVLKSLPDHAQGTPCALILALADLLDNIVMAGQSSAPPMLANTPPQPPPPPMSASSQSSQQQPQQQMVNHNSPYTMDQPSTSSSPAHVHTSPAPDHSLSAPSPHMSNNTNAMAPTPASNYHLHNPVQTQNPFQHSQVPTVTGLADLSAWANFDPSSSEIVIGNSFADASPHPATQYTPAPNMMQQHSHSSNQHHYGTPMIYGQGHP